VIATSARSFLILSLVLLSSAAFAADSEPAPETKSSTSTSSDKTEQKVEAEASRPVLTSSVNQLNTMSPDWPKFISRFSGAVGFAYSNGFTDSADPESMISVSASYKISNQQSVSVIQDVIKKYVVDPGESETDPRDTIFRYTYTFPQKMYDVQLALKGSLTFPASDFSRRNDVRTKPELRAAISRGFFGDKLEFMLSPFARYYVNEFKTTQSGLGAGGGKPLPQYVFGTAGSVSYRILKPWSVFVSGFWQDVNYEDLEIANRESRLGIENPSKHQYSFGLGTSYEIQKNWTVSVSTSQLSYAEQDGRLEVYSFDPYTTDWSVETQLRF
jgi:opacity protein-like surface antigen